MRVVPRAAVLQDMVGIGRCSLTVILPALSALGVQCCPIPTAVLSAHTAFESPYKLPLTQAMRGITARYLQDGEVFEAAFSGYLGDEEQLEIALDFLQGQKGLRLVDPVLGDGGRLYASMSPHMVDGMRRMIDGADIITPNLTEAALLLGEEPRSALTPVLEREWLLRLGDMGAKNVIITSCNRQGEEAIAAVVLHEKGLGRAVAPRLAQQFPGTGDLFAAVLLGALLRGQEIPRAVCLAAGFVYEAMEDTIGAGTPPKEGVLVERNLQKLWRVDAPAATWEE